MFNCVIAFKLKYARFSVKHLFHITYSNYMDVLIDKTDRKYTSITTLNIFWIFALLFYKKNGFITICLTRIFLLYEIKNKLFIS